MIPNMHVLQHNKCIKISFQFPLPLIIWLIQVISYLQTSTHRNCSQECLMSRPLKPYEEWTYLPKNTQKQSIARSVTFNPYFACYGSLGPLLQSNGSFLDATRINPQRQLHPNQPDLLGKIEEHNTSKIFTTMFLLTIFNPFLTRELRITGFEGVPTEIYLKQRADKTDRQTACRQDRVLGDVSWTRGKCQKHECHS